MGFMEAVKSVYSRYVDFQGRSPRSEFWWFVLFYFIIYIVLAVIGVVTEGLGMILLVIFLLGTIIPYLAVSIRRLHDLDKSGWWILISFIPIVGLILIYWYCLKGTDGDNQFGPDPLGNVADRFD